MYYKIKFLCCFLILFFLQKNSTAQDVHFSQIESSPLLMSPATAGYLDEATDRFTLKYRNQWSAILPEQSFETFAATYDGRFCFDNSDNFFGYGLSAMEDQVGDPVFKTSQYQAAFAYHFRLTTGSFLSLGFQSGLLRYRIDPKDFNFDHEFDGGVGFFNLPNSNDILNDSEKLIWDVGAGALLYHPDRSWNVGISFQHDVKRSYFAFTETGIEDNNRVPTRWLVNASFPISFSLRGKHHHIIPKVIFLLQRPHWQVLTGADFRLNILEGTYHGLLENLTLGIAARASNHPSNSTTFDAGVVSLNLEISHNLHLGTSYDFTFSSLQNSNRSMGSLEMSMVFLINSEKRNNCIDCFKFDRKKKGYKPVSYTHLTLPTICSV